MPEFSTLDQMNDWVDSLTQDWDAKRDIFDRLKKDLEITMDAAEYEMVMFEEMGWTPND